jgi:hypothetical protein
VYTNQIEFTVLSEIYMWHTSVEPDRSNYLTFYALSLIETLSITQKTNFVLDYLILLKFSEIISPAIDNK